MFQVLCYVADVGHVDVFCTESRIATASHYQPRVGNDVWGWHCFACKSIPFERHGLSLFAMEGIRNLNDMGGGRLLEKRELIHRGQSWRTKFLEGDGF